LSCQELSQEWSQYEKGEVIEVVSEVELERAIELYQLSELAKPENARWFALLIDAEGATGWVHLIKKENRIDEEYRYVYRYYIPYITVSMSKRESRKTIEEGQDWRE